MDSTDYREPVKTCFLQTCFHNDVKNPGLRFFTIRKELKESWCLMIGRNCPKRPLFCCEDHINVEEDIENYEQWMSGAKPRLKLNTTLKNINLANVERYTSNVDINNIKTTISRTADILKPSNAHVAIQCERIEHKNFAILVKPSTKDKSTNFRARTVKQKIMPSLKMHSDIEEDVVSQSPSLFGTSNFDSTSSSAAQCYDKKLEGREHIMKVIKDKPKMYLGLPKNYWWVINLIAQQFSSVALHIIITLFKIKNNDSFNRMRDTFEITRCTIRLLFEKNVIILATYFQNFIYLPPAIEIKKNLPLPFKIRYSSVQCIIDCFEIQIDEPSNPVKQAQTWSQYKSCNTVKYLLGCTPAGLICFVSRGFGGRISDKNITEKSGFIDILPVNAVIMADRGFKEIEALLSAKNIKLLRPPSVYQNKRMSKKEVMETKVIASLRVHVERVIRRVREFHMLKPHSVVNNKHVQYLDEIVIIACGLINLQEPIIKQI